MRLLVGLCAFLFVTSGASAGALKWGSGWAGVNETLNYTESYVSYDYFSASKYLRVTYSFIGAKPKKLYQVGVHIYCNTPIAAFGQFSTNTKSCVSHTIDGVTKSVDSVELGMVLTDAGGNGSFEVNVGPLKAGTYNVQFSVRTDAGCYMSGYPASSPKCAVIFSAPAGFGKMLSLNVK